MIPRDKSETELEREYSLLLCSFNIYNAASADREYKDILSEARTGISYSEEEIAHLDQLISPLIRDRKSTRLNSSHAT